MKMRYFVFVVSLFITSTKASVEDIVKANVKEFAFNSSVFTQLKQQHLGKNWLIILWSLDCHACFKELALVQKMLRKDKKLAIVLINVDDNQILMQERLNVLAKYQLGALQHFYFLEGQAAAGRYMLDPSWYGELPRSYFIAQQGRFFGRSGLIAHSTIKQWLTIK